MKIVHLSKRTVITETPTTEPNIYVFTQFFIHKNAQRNQEIRHCLKQNVENPKITQVCLLNERIYTNHEMGLGATPPNNKLIQTNIAKRLTYQDIFAYVRIRQLKGYIVITNADIFFDDTIEHIQSSTLHEPMTNTHKKQMFALLRYEYNPIGGTQQSPIFGPRFDSQDTWIFHTNNFIEEQHEKAFNITLGQPGCDNKLLYMVSILGYEPINDPFFVKTFHYHQSRERDYTIKDVIQEPWAVIVPVNANPMTIQPALGIQLPRILQMTRGFKDTKFNDNDRIFQYIQSKITTNQPFIIPRVCGIENNFAVFGRICRDQKQVPPEIQQYFEKVVPAMKNNAGILLTTIDSIIQYSNMYLEAFDQCEMFAGWDAQGNYIGHIAQSYEYILKHYQSNREIVWALNFDIFHYIYSNPWTRALQNKRILVISPFEESILEKIPIREKIYDGVDLFPGCTFTTIRPPQTQAGEPSQEFHIELERFFRLLDERKDTYDVALVSCGGYGNLVCSYIYQNGKSSIYIGGVLQMYFGILGNRWMKERPDVIRLFLNKHWSRPKESEKPKNFKNVENGCYW